jgi:hypothetical protein
MAPNAYQRANILGSLKSIINAALPCCGPVGDARSLVSYADRGNESVDLVLKPSFNPDGRLKAEKAKKTVDKICPRSAS